ncbi:oligosaccharide repeat unit polymerase, partial [Escherichia coli]|nr:oligosaccharide repeat unit polymerase [Escherichia coli]
LCILLLSYTIPSLARFLEFFRFFYFILVVRMLMQFNVRSRYLFFVIILAYCFMRLNSFINQFDSGFDYIYNGKIL